MPAVPSIRPFPGFNANSDAEALKKAMKGLGCNHLKVIHVVCRRTNKQRREIAKAYKELYSRDLNKDLHHELVGELVGLVAVLMELPAVYDAKEIHKALEGNGAKDHVLVEILCLRSNHQIHDICHAYQLLYKKNLDKDLIQEKSNSCFRRLLATICTTKRDETRHVSENKAKQAANELYKAGAGKLGVEGSPFVDILASNNFYQLRIIFDEYKKLSNHSMEHAIEWEFSGVTRDCLLELVAFARDRAAHFAKLISDTIKKLGVDDDALMRLIITRSEFDLAEIRNVYQSMYKAPLDNTVARTCSSTFKDALVALIEGN